MLIPPYDSVDYINWSSGVSGSTLRFLINDFDHHQVEQLRQILADGFWYGGNPYTLEKNELFDEIAAAVRSHQLIVAADPSKDYHIKHNVMNWLVQPGDNQRLDWIKQSGWANTVETVNRTSGHKFKRYDEKPKRETPKDKILAAKPVEANAPTTIDVAIQVVDDATGDPIPNVELLVTLPNTAIQQITTNSAGLAKLSSSKAGNIILSSPWQGKTLSQTACFVNDSDQPSGKHTPAEDPAWIDTINCIGQITEYQAQEGDGLNTIAMEHDIDEQTIALFNWQTDDLGIANDKLEAAGAGFRNDNGEAIFANGDSGNVLIPGEWELGGLHTGSSGLRTHIIRVRPITTTLGRFYIQLFADEKSAEEYSYQLEIPGKDPLKGQTENQGRIEFDLPENVAEILLTVWPYSEYPDEPVRWTLAKSDLKPVAEKSGMIQRLCNLGYLITPDANPDECVDEALRLFKKSKGLGPGDEYCDMTQQSLNKPV